MKIDALITNETLLQEVGKRVSDHRLYQNMTQAALAEQAGISKRTLERLEAGEVATHLSSFLRVCRVLGLLGRFDALLPELQPGPMAQLKFQGRQRKRASGSRIPDRVEEKWVWGDPS